ncbi:MAG TPA: ATP F0F1 synthase subunit gamma, partial [Desulfobacteraceae bacterium]|nr:ATP F0F1 synthase subunit gamma [Desulfobacteraceae bacterium]
MATLRDVLNKISAIKKTRQITKAMNMVAAAKLRSAQGRMESFKPYAIKFAEVLNHLSSLIEPDIHPLLGKKQAVKKVELLHFSADRGLCGSFNVNSINTAEKWLKEKQSKGIECSLTLVGKKGKRYFSKKNYGLTDSYV